MDKPPALVSKLDAARRQLDASIKMLLSGDDPLAVHTVAGAAAKLLEELHWNQSRNPIQDQLASGVLRAVRDYLSGKQFPTEMFNVAQRLSSNLTEDQKRFLVDFDISAADVTSLATCVPKVTSDQVRSELFKTVNFLKHSKRDADAQLMEKEIDNIRLLYHAIKNYESLGLPSTTQMIAFTIYWLAHCDWHDSYLPPSVRDHLIELRGKDEPEVRAYCLSMLDQP
jgi:hypothetical protein